MHVFILTGAGISAESGLNTFRDPGGLWENHDPRRLATPEAFARDPDLVHRFYNWRRGAAAAAVPNAAHLALAQLERVLAARGDRVTLVTQNVDDLHQRAGSKVLAMHGTHTRGRCTHCMAVMAWSGDMSTATPCPRCDQTGGMRPDIVWFGETPHHLDAIAAALADADLFAAIGTSGAVYPAAAYAGAARTRGIPTIELNLAAADNAELFDRAVYGMATVTVPRFVADLIAGPSPDFMRERTDP